VNLPLPPLSRGTRAMAAVTLLAPALLACGGAPSGPDPAGGSPAEDPGGDDHGAVEGARELDEPALGLTTVDPGGRVRHLDLLSEDTTDLARLPGTGAASTVHTDGRFLYVQGREGLQILDSGVWTWDHVDHFHYYRAEPREVGAVPGGSTSTVATTTSSTSGGAGVFFTDSGEAAMLDVASLADGETAERYRLETEPHDGMLVPVGDHALLTRAGAGPGSERSTADRVVVLDAGGEPVPGAEHACRRASGTIATRVGTVVGCADGALLATVTDGEVEVVRIPVPQGGRARGAAPATSFAGRDGRPTVAGLAGPRGRDGVWLLDTREQAWRLLDVSVPLTQVTAVDDEDEHVLGLTPDGRVVVIDGTDGRLLARTRPLAARSMASGTGTPTLVVDQQRAYLSAPAERRVHEIDFADGGRISRTFPTATVPALLAGTGR